MKYIIALSILFIFGRCSKEEQTLYKAYLKNTTSHTILIKPYFGGSNPASKTITLLSNETKEIANGFDRGIVGNAGFHSSYFAGSDSVVVSFNNSYSITHYFNPPLNFARKYYLVNSNRNLYNKESFSYNYQDQSKRKRVSTYIYEFTEQDYLNAQ